MASIHDMPTGLVMQIVLSSVVRSLRSIHQTARHTLRMSLYSGTTMLPSLRKSAFRARRVYLLSRFPGIPWNAQPTLVKGS